MMFIPKNYSLWIKVALAAIVVTVGLAFVGSGAKATTGCQKVNGKFTLKSLSGPTCTSSVNLCALGTYKGGLKGDSNFTGTSLIQTADTPATNVLLLTGDNVIHLAGGDLFTKDAIVFRTSGAGEFGEVDTIVGGTGDWLGASGVLQATGTFTLEGGEGDYTGDVYLP